MKRRTWRSEIMGGLRITGVIAAIVIWLGVTVAGITTISGGGGSTVVGVLCLAVGLPITYLTAHRWVSVLPGVLAYGIIGALAALVTGQIGLSKAAVISKWEASNVLAMVVAGALLAATFRGRVLTKIDRVALVGSVYSFAYAGALGKHSLLGGYVMICCLFAGWLIHGVRRRMEPSGSAGTGATSG